MPSAAAAVRVAVVAQTIGMRQTPRLSDTQKKRVAPLAFLHAAGHLCVLGAGSLAVTQVFQVRQWNCSLCFIHEEGREEVMPATSKRRGGRGDTMASYFAVCDGCRALPFFSLVPEAGWGCCSRDETLPALCLETMTSLRWRACIYCARY